MMPTASSRKIRVAICDDHPIVRAGFRQFLAGQSDVDGVREAENGREALDLVRKCAMIFVMCCCSTSPCQVRMAWTSCVP